MMASAAAAMASAVPAPKAVTATAMAVNAVQNATVNVAGVTADVLVNVVENAAARVVTVKTVKTASRQPSQPTAHRKQPVLKLGANHAPYAAIAMSEAPAAHAIKKFKTRTAVPTTATQAMVRKKL